MVVSNDDYEGIRMKTRERVRVGTYETEQYPSFNPFEYYVNEIIISSDKELTIYERTDVVKEEIMLYIPECYMRYVTVTKGKEGIDIERSINLYSYTFEYKPPNLLGWPETIGVDVQKKEDLYKEYILKRTALGLPLNDDIYNRLRRGYE